MWWWGEQELPGLQAFVDDSVKNYSAATVKTMLQDTAVVISQFQTAAAAGKAPDIQYLWNGIYHMESVWLGYLAPLDGLVSDDVLDASQPTLLSQFDGKTYRHGLVSAADDLDLQQGPLRQGGPRRRQSAQDLGRSPRRLRQAEGQGHRRRSAAASRTAIGANGSSAMPWRRTSTAPARRSSCSPASGISRDPKYYEQWSRLEELKKHDFLNADMSSLELYPGIDLIVAGKLAMGESIGARVPADSKTTNGRIGCMVMPVYGKGKMAGKPILDAQGLGISTNAKDPKAAAAFLEYLESPERLKVFWEKTGWIPPAASSTPRSSRTRSVMSMWKTWGEGDNIPYVSNLVPGQFYEQALLPTGAAGRRRARSPARRPASLRPRSPRNGATSIPTWSKTTRSGRQDLSG